jgi:retron-type reverse transcriptase
VLGIPNVIDRVAQTAAVLALEPNVEKLFHNDSYGYVCPEQEGSLM